MSISNLHTAASATADVAGSALPWPAGSPVDPSPAPACGHPDLMALPQGCTAALQANLAPRQRLGKAPDVQGPPPGAAGAIQPVPGPTDLPAVQLVPQPMENMSPEGGSRPPPAGPAPRRSYGQLGPRPAHGLQPQLPYAADRIDADQFAAAKQTFRTTGSVTAAARSIAGEKVTDRSLRRWLSNAGERFAPFKGPLTLEQIETALKVYQHHWNEQQHLQKTGALEAARQAVGGAQTIRRSAMKEYFFAGGLSGLGKAMRDYASHEAWLERTQEANRPRTRRRLLSSLASRH
jgi:hypothetical protein